MKLNLISKALVVVLSATSLVACNSDDNGSVQLPPADLQFSFGLDNTKEIANNNNIPMPNDLYFIGEDGFESATNNLIFFDCGNTNEGLVTEDNIQNATKCSLEDLDGWSTTAPFTLPMSGDLTQLDSDTFESSVLVFNQKTGKYLKYDQDFTVRTTEFNHLQILPLKPLGSDTQYILAITTDLKSTSGEAVKPADSFTDLLGGIYTVDEPIFLAYQNQVNSLSLVLEELEKNAVSSNSLLYIAGIKTQNTGKVLTKLANSLDSKSSGLTSIDTPEKHLVGAGLPPAVLDNIVGGIIGGIIGTPNIDPNFCDSNIGDKDGLFIDCVRKLQASVTLPYYLTTPSSNNCEATPSSKNEAKFWFNIDGINVAENESYFESYLYKNDETNGCPSLYSSWEIENELPKTQELQTLAVQVVLPNAERNKKPDAGWPVVIFSHGITAAKEFGNGGMLILDNFVQAELANQGYAVIAIDHPLHNSRAIDLDGDNTYEINASQSLRGLFSGHDNADVKNYLKADALLTSRDNLRQSVADLINLRASIGSEIAYLDSDGNPIFDENNIPLVEDLDRENVYVMGHSMGSIAAASLTGILDRTTTFKKMKLNGAILANPGAGIAGILMNSVWFGQSEVPPAIKATEEYRLRMAKELGLDADLAAVRDYAEQNPVAYKQKSDQLSPEYLSEFQYLIQAVVDTVDPINYIDELKNKPILSLTVAGSISEQPELQDVEGNLFTTADQTVPIKVELDGQTTYEVCNQASAVAGDVASQDLGCFNGSTAKPYYSLNNTEFPLSGAEPLETQLGLRNVLNSTDRSYTRFLTGTHNIGAGTLTGSETEGNADYASVDSAATELTKQAASFVEYSLENKKYVQGSHRVAPEDLTIIEIEK